MNQYKKKNGNVIVELLKEDDNYAWIKNVATGHKGAIELAIFRESYESYDDALLDEKVNDDLQEVIEVVAELEDTEVDTKASVEVKNNKNNKGKR